MDSNRIKDIDARHGTQDENGNGARDAAIRKMGKEVQDLAGGSRENERGAHKNGRTREGARNGMRGGARFHSVLRGHWPTNWRKWRTGRNS